MTNKQALRGICNAIASAFYPDDATITQAMVNDGISPDAEATQKDKRLFLIAVSLIVGMVEETGQGGG